MMTATIIHETRMASVRCAAPVPVEVHCVSVLDGRQPRPWEFSINPRVNTPLRRAIVCAHAIAYVQSKVAA